MEDCRQWSGAVNSESLLEIFLPCSTCMETVRREEYFILISLWLVWHFNPFVLPQGLPFLQCSPCLSGKWGGKKDAHASMKKWEEQVLCFCMSLFPLHLKSSLVWFDFKGRSPTICILVLYIIYCTLLPNKYVYLRSRDPWIQNWWADKAYLKESREVPPQ